MMDGRTAREHVRAYARRDPVGGAAALADVTPALPPLCAVLAVEAFEVLSSTRGASGMNGPNAITLADVQSYGAVMGVELTPREAQWVLDQDAEFLTVIAEAPTDG